MNIQNSIDIKKEKLANELKRKKPDWNIVKRLKESIRRHTKEARYESRKRKFNKHKGGKIYIGR